MKKQNVLSTISTVSLVTTGGVLTLPWWMSLIMFFVAIIGLAGFCKFMGAEKITEILKTFFESWGKERKDCGCK